MNTPIYYVGVLTPDQARELSLLTTKRAISECGEGEASGMLESYLFDWIEEWAFLTEDGEVSILEAALDRLVEDWTTCNL
ncbi:hypothetical protein G7067_05250 [Leucobacter insecticola]|uniref:Uncharacterized protein n=1 Tax=Leucobacter insecticola TaxID=2714934 RepID=A0A6G8FHM8_9MICO|nr:hypothetical protein [Leucobacter insecticola]QIM15960.1 hypothetical protein G7067_05250 [Leucobacter insecticola]